MRPGEGEGHILIVRERISRHHLQHGSFIKLQMWGPVHVGIGVVCVSFNCIVSIVLWSPSLACGSHKGDSGCQGLITGRPLDKLVLTAVRFTFIFFSGSPTKELEGNYEHVIGVGTV